MKKVSIIHTTNWWFLKPTKMPQSLKFPHDNNKELFFIRKEKDNFTYWFIGYEDDFGLIHNINDDIDESMENSLEIEFQEEIKKEQ